MAELRARLLAMPVEITVPDAVTGGDLSYKRDDIMRALIIDRTDLAGEACVVAGQYVEVARIERACRAASERAATAYAQWKAKIATEYRETADKPSDKRAEAAYRTHKDYEKHAGLGAYYEQLAELFSDVKKAFDIKSRQIISLNGGQREHLGVEKRGSGVNVPIEQELSELDDFVARSIEETRRAEAAPKVPPAPKIAPPPAPPALDEDEEEEDADPAPPPPPKRQRRPARAVQVPIPAQAPPADEDEEDAAVEDDDEIELIDEDEDAPPPRRPKGGKK